MSASLQIDEIYRSESGRVLATLVRILGDLDLAEEALQDAFQAALEKWPEEGLPKNPYAWLVSAGKFRAIDALRRKGRGTELILEQAASGDGRAFEAAPEIPEEHIVGDDQLRLVFICCHPRLPLDSRIALSLKEVCGLPTAEIARAYFVPTETVKKRISRAKALIKELRLPYEIPNKAELAGRLDAVLHVIYLVYNEGYSASSGEDHIRRELTDEAVFLARQVAGLMPMPQSLGLLALLLLHESRRAARLDDAGDIVTLEEQDRSRWNRDLINEGLELIQKAVWSGRLGPYTVQAAIASVHAAAPSVDDTRWDVIAGYYDMLLQMIPSPVVELNRAVAVGMHLGPRAGLDILDGLSRHKQLKENHMLYAVRADFERRLGNTGAAAGAYRRALEFVRQQPEERYLHKKLSELNGITE